VPLILFGLIANFIPYLMYITPVEETSVCMLFFLTKSPFQLDSIDNSMFYSSITAKYIYHILELYLLYYYNKKLNNMILKQENIKTESRKIVIIWFLFTLMNVIFLLFEDIF